MPRTDAQERGIQFEHYVAEVLSGQVVAGSGNKFYNRSDVTSAGLRISAKSEKGLTLARVLAHLREAIDLAFQSGEIPALAIQDIDHTEEYIVIRLSDFAKALQEVTIPETFASKGLEKRQTAETPIMLR